MSLNWLDVSILAFWGYTCLRLAFTPYVTFDNKRFIVLTLLTLLYFVFKWVVQKNDQKKEWTVERKIVISGFLLGGLLQSLFCMLQLYDVNPWYASNHFKVVGTFGNPDAVAGYLATVIPFAFGVWQLTAKPEVEVRWIRMLGMMTFLAGVFVLPATLIRGAWLAVAAGTGFCLFYKYRLWFKLREVFTTKWRRVGGAFIALLLVSAVMIGLYRLKPDSAYGRLLIWKITSEMIAQFPLFGLGYDRYTVEYGNAQAAYFASGRGTPYEEQLAGNVHHAHNEYLQVLAEGGIVGLVIVVSVALFALWVTRRLFSQTNVDDIISGRVLLVSARASLVAILVSSLFSFPVHILPTAINLVFLLSLISCLAWYKKAAEVDFYPWRLRQLGIVGITTILIVLPFFHGSYRAYARWNVAFAKAHAMDFDAAIMEYKSLEKHFADDGKFLFMYGATLGLAGQDSASIDVLEKAKKRFSDPNLWIALGQSYEAIEDYASAEKHYAHASNMIPHKLYPRYLLAKLCRKTGREEDARHLARRIVQTRQKVQTTAADEIKAEMRALLQLSKPN